MAPDITEVLDAVRTMTEQQRADVAYQVLLTLDVDSDSDQPAVEESWRREIRRRVNEHRAGTAEMLDLEASHAQLRAELTADL